MPDIAKKAQEARSKKFGIRIRDDGSVIKPSQYESVPDSEFADPVNYAYPIDTEHVMAAYKYFAKPANQGFYNADEKKIIWKRIIEALPANNQDEAKKVSGLNFSEVSGEDAQAETQLDELVDQLEEIHDKIKELIKGKTGAPATRHQMQMVSKLLGQIKITEPPGEAQEGSSEPSSMPGMMSSDSEIVNFTAEDMPDNVIEFSSEVGPGESITKQARIFYIGKHKGRDYTKDDMKRIVDNFDPKEEIPLQLDHSKSAKDTIGYPRTMTLSPDGTEIYSDIEILGKDNVEKVRLGLWKKLSSGLSIRLPEMKADHVAVTPFPALTSATMFSKYDDVINDAQELLRKSFGKAFQFSQEGLKALKEEFGRSSDKLQKFGISDNEKGGTKNMGDTKATETQVNMADFEAMKAEFARLEKEKGVLEEKIQFKEDQEFIETFAIGTEIKTTPAMKPLELKLYHSLNQEQREMFSELKKAQPAFIDLTIHSTQKAVKPGEFTDEQINKQADQILEHTK